MNKAQPGNFPTVAPPVQLALENLDCQIAALTSSLEALNFKLLPISIPGGIEQTQESTGNSEVPIINTIQKMQCRVEGLVLAVDNIHSRLSV